MEVAEKWVVAGNRAADHQAELALQEHPCQPRHSSLQTALAKELELVGHVQALILRIGTKAVQAHPKPVVNHGPKFLQAPGNIRSVIEKVHKNQGHPTSEQLAVHLAAAGAHSEVVAAARDYQCPACIEHRPPAQHAPGSLREAKDFNDKVSIDGCYWKSQSGFQVHVIHAIDEATHFHLGRRSLRDAQSTQKCFNEFWCSWAGFPQELQFDPAGELISQSWKDFLQREGIRPVLTAESWHHGRIERHGGILKEMLNRIDHGSPIRTEAEFDQALLQCFRAKNSMANVHGYSPEQAVLGKMSKLPGSLTSDQDLESHQLASEDHPAARRFQEHLNLRTRARQAFLEADNASALRRAVLRKSRRDIQPWQVGQLCMYWDKHRAPNMIEKGRWCGPAQVVLHESRSIVWITHLNRLLRCARENLRPVSMREFSRRPQATALENDERIAQMARQLERNLRERVGMFQFHDLSDPVAPPPEVEEQPEEEPRRTSETSTESRSIGIQDPSEAEVEAHEIPVPETPKEAHEVPVPDHGSDLDINDQESVREPNDVGEVDEGESSNRVATVSHTDVVYNAEMIEGCGGPVCFWGDESGLWDPHFAANNQGMADESVFTLELEMPMQRFHRYCKDPVLHEAYIVDAAKKAKSEVQFSSLNSEDKERFRQAKAKELRCWIETSAVEKIMRHRLHREQIMTSRWILTLYLTRAILRVEKRRHVWWFGDSKIPTWTRSRPIRQLSLVMGEWSCCKQCLRRDGRSRASTSPQLSFEDARTGESWQWTLFPSSGRSSSCIRTKSVF